MSKEELVSAVLSLSRDDRAKLAHDLIESLHDETGPRRDERWLQEILQRAREVADGSVEPVDWEDIEKGLARRLKERRGAV